MIQFCTGNLLKAPVEAIVNPVNCVGVMGKGLALQVKQAFPKVFPPYSQACRKKRLRPGVILTTPTGMSRPKYVIHFPTKVHWRDPSRIEYIERGLSALVSEIDRLHLSTLAVPPLGCGLGGLAWKDVQPLLKRAFVDLDGTDVLVYQPIPLEG